MSDVAVAMSGGVDSSVAALILKERGYNVIGVHLKLFDSQIDASRYDSSCCTLESAQRVKAVCDKIGADFYVLNYKDKFEQQVIKPFIEAYLSGRTPNPCVACNHHIKFDALLKQMKAIGVDYIATGHYVRKERDNDKWIVLRGVDRLKDQSYFLYMLNQSILQNTLFPNGEHTKEEIRKIASNAGLETADRPESQEICFAQDESYASLIESRFPSMVKEGDIVNIKGEVLGRHKGIVYYTSGQRKGLGIAHSEPLYVLEIRPETNEVVVGTKDYIYADGLIFNEESFVSGISPKKGEKVEVQIRYNASPVLSTFEGAVREGLKLRFDKPQPAVTPGQAVVLYHGDKLLGGGTIILPLKSE